MQVIDRECLNELLRLLSADGFTLVGPTVRDEVIVYDEINSADDLPVGITDRQEPGSYRLAKRDDEALFGFVVGPHSFKKYLFPPSTKLFQVSINGGQPEFSYQEVSDKRYAFIGVRACELSAMSIQGKVFVDGPFTDPQYARRQASGFVLAVNCTEPGGACFCASMGTGPKAESDFDLALTEVIDGDNHVFLVEVGSDSGRQLLDRVAHRPATDEMVARCDRMIEGAKGKMGRTQNTDDLPGLFKRNMEHPRWNEVAERCLSCANCTMVCPTCFCSTVEDVTDLTGEHAERWRRWDSCFTMDFSYIAGGTIRGTTRSRYRQWLSHKLGTWQEQFGTTGCVGCGRCITWCPVGIDITEETAAIRDSEPRT